MVVAVEVFLIAQYYAGWGLKWACAID